MLRKLKLFGFGVIIGLIIIFSNERLKNNFFDYVNWGDSNQWVINQLLRSDTIIYSNNLQDKISKNQIENSYLLKVLEGGWVNTIKSDKYSDPQIFYIDNIVNGSNLSVKFSFSEDEKVEVLDFYLDEEISKKSYLSYIVIFCIFLVIMLPVLFFVRKLITKRRLKDE